METLGSLTAHPEKIMKTCVTGANGFVGSALCSRLILESHILIQAVRKSSNPAELSIGEINATTNWKPALADCHAVIHLAARVHIMADKSTNPLTEFRAVNTEGTLNLARQAAQVGVKRFIFVSSIKVNGEGRNEPYRETDLPAPQDPYAVSKWEAEQGLAAIGLETGLEVVILRPPLVYGPGVRANFLRLMQFLDRGLPLPLGRVENQRSLLFLGNLVDAIQVCLQHPAAANKTYLLSDGEDVSSAELVRVLAKAMGRRPRLLPVPVSLLRLAGTLLGKSAEMSRLLGSLAVDGSRIQQELDWRPPYSLNDGIAQTVRVFQRWD